MISKYLGSDAFMDNKDKEILELMLQIIENLD